MHTVVRAVEDADVNPGLLGFIVVALLGVATWLLIKSMNRHLRRVDFSEGDAMRPDAGKTQHHGDAEKTTEHD